MFGRFGFIALFIAVPLIELVLLIQLGKVVGVLATIGIVIATAVIGTTLLRGQGFGVLARATNALEEGQAPVEPVVEGLFLLIAGAFLLTPGLLTDAAGFALLVPPFRQRVAKWALKKVMASGLVNVSVFGSDAQFEQDIDPRDYHPGDPGDAGPARGRPHEPDIIDGEFERLDEKTTPRRPPRS